MVELNKCIEHYSSLIKAVNVKFAGLNNIDGPRKPRDPLPSDEPNSFSLSNGSTTAGGTTANGDTENDESTEDRSELDSSEMDDVSTEFKYYLDRCCALISTALWNNHILV